MRSHFIVAVVAVISFSQGRLGAGDAEPNGVIPPGDKTPILRLETRGPRSFVSSLAFNPSGQQLYIAGWDKLVQVWIKGKDGNYVYNSAAALRVPVGSGLYGGISAMALSEDGAWLAVGGLGHARDLSGEKRTGWIVPSGMRTDSALLDEGMIYVFNLSSPLRDTTLLRGHRGPIQSLAFVRGVRTANAEGIPIPPELVSVAEEPFDDSTAKPEIRFWSVQNAKTVARLAKVPARHSEGERLEDLPALKGYRPGLTAWSTGPEAKQARVAIAWGDHLFRVWNVESDGIVYGEGGDLTLIASPLSKTNDKFLTCAHGAIGTWTLPQFVSGRMDLKSYEPADIPEVNGRQFHLPRSIVHIRDSEGNPEYVGLIVSEQLTDEQKRGRAKYRLLIASASPSVKTVRELDLGEDILGQPSLAITQDGQTLAVAGISRSEVRVFSVKDLLAGNLRNLQLISSTGEQFKDAAFVRDEQRWGLQLSKTPRDRISGKFPVETRVLDLFGRHIEKTTEKWQLAEAASPGWSAKVPQAGLMTVERPNRTPLELKLEKDFVAVSVAFCRSSKACPFPLVAVASQRQGEPLLQLFHGDTGFPLRWCEGHTQRIRSLSFSSDGRMLLSVADDRTISVWTVADLMDRVVNLRGRIPGLVVRVHEDQLVVIDPGSSPLRKDDVLLSLRANGESTFPKTAKEFYRAILDRVPGDQIEVTARRKGAVQKVTCNVDQAVDEAKPLFTLFVAPAEQGDDWEWIAWHPLGNFDFQGDRVERQLGWHFNTDDPAHPVSFSTLDNYRDQFLRPDLLRLLIETQKLPVAEVAAVRPQVKLSIRDTSANVPDDQSNRGTLRITSRQAQLVAELAGVADRRVREFDLTINSEKPIRLSPSVDREWIVDLSESDLKRGPQHLVTKLTTTDFEFSHEQTAFFQPRSPTIVWDQLRKNEVTGQTAKIVATIQPVGEPFGVELIAQASGQPPRVIRVWEFERGSPPLSIEENVDMEPGENHVRLVCWNTDPDHPGQRFESDFKAIRMTRTPNSSSPRISKVAFLTDRDDVTTRIDPNEQDVFRITKPNLWVTGFVESANSIAELELTIGKESYELLGFMPNRLRQYKIESQLTFQPGQRELVLIKASAEGAATERRFEIEYQPILPSVTSLKVRVAAPVRTLPPHIKRTPMVFYSNYDSNQCRVTAMLDGEFDQPCAGEYFINGQPQGSIPIQPGQTEVTREFSLSDGRSHIEFRVRAIEAPSQEADQNTESIDVVYGRPPLLGILNSPSREVVAGKNFRVDCSASSALAIKRATLIVDGRSHDMQVSLIENQTHNWSLKFDGALALTNGKHTLQINAFNDDGESLEPAFLEVDSVQVAARPKLELFNAATTTTSQPTIEVEFKVTFSSPVDVLYDVLAADGKVEQARGGRLPELPADGRSTKVRVSLAEGNNLVRLVAYGQESRSETQELNVTYIVPPMAVEILTVDGRQPDFQDVWSNDEKESHLKSRVSKNLISIRGRVSAREPLTYKVPLYAHIWVNSFKLPTVPVTLDPKDPSKGFFASNVSFNRKSSNLIRMKIIGKDGLRPAELAKTGAMLVDCEMPVRNQTLYLLLLGTGDSKRTEAQSRAFLAATKLDRNDQSKVWKSASFSEIFVINAMNENLPHVHGKMIRLQELMETRSRIRPESGTNSIVLVLFQGRMKSDPNDFHLFTDVPVANRTIESNDLLSGKHLERQMMKIFGAHLLLLDVQQSEIVKDSFWPQAPHLGMLVAHWNSDTDRPEETRLISDLRPIYDELRQIVTNFEKVAESYSGKIESFDRLQNHYDLQFGFPQ